jgi:hypothetical protein
MPEQRTNLGAHVLLIMSRAEIFSDLGLARYARVCVITS